MHSLYAERKEHNSLEDVIPAADMHGFMAEDMAQQYSAAKIHPRWQVNLRA